MAETSVEALLLDIFGGNPYHAIAKAKADGSSAWYEPVKKPLTKGRILDHLEGRAILGSYPVLSTQTVKWLGWDVDAEGNMPEAREIVTRLTHEIEYLPYVVEYSGGKGYHVLLFLDEPMSAAKAKAFSEHIRDVCGFSKTPKKGHPHVECYPKQGMVSPNGTEEGSRQKLGNLLKIPLGRHMRTGNWSRFVDPDNGWEDGPSLPPEEMLQFRVSPSRLAVVEASATRVEKLVELLAKEWVPGERHNLSLFLSGYLATANWTQEQAEGLITAICRVADDDDEFNRLETVHESFRKHGKGETIAGFQRLGEMLPAATMAQVVQLVAELAAPDTSRKIEQIRLSKGPVWKKEDRAANLIWSHLTDPNIGRIIRTVDDRYYWFDVENKDTIEIGTPDWSAALYKIFRLNPAESFGKHIQTVIELRARSEGILGRVYRGSHWDGNRLLLNLGDKRVWSLDGSGEPLLTYNGQDNIMFLTEPGSRHPTPDWSDPMDIWEVLVEDINFATSRHAPIPPEEQKEMLKAWILSTFFREELPTRPILTMLGDPGSGKTTAAKRIVQLLEGVQSNVLSVEEDKPDFWRTVIAHHRVFVLDNLETTRAGWLVNGLDRIATGSAIEIRRLYQTNAVYRIIPDCFVMLTAVNMPFSKETLFERLLVINMEKLNNFIPQRIFEMRLKQNIDRLWGDLILKLDGIVAILKEVKHVNQAVSLRMADYAQFCERIRGSDAIEGDVLKRGLAVLGSSQQLALAQSEHSAYPLIQEWVETFPEEAAQWHTVNELFAILAQLAGRSRRAFRWKNSRGFSSHLKAMEGVLVQTLGAKVKDNHRYENGYWIKGYCFRPQMEVEVTSVNGGSE